MNDRIKQNRTWVDPSQTPPQVKQGMVALAALLIATRRTDLRAGVEEAGRFFKIVVTETVSAEALKAWNDEPNKGGTAAEGNTEQ